MMGLTNFITEANWKDVFTIWFVLVDDACQALERQFGSQTLSGAEYFGVMQSKRAKLFGLRLYVTTTVPRS